MKVADVAAFAGNRPNILATLETVKAELARTTLQLDVVEKETTADIEALEKKVSELQAKLDAIDKWQAVQ